MVDVKKLLEIIANNDIVVYGAGYVAERFYMALQQRNLQNKIKCFVVTNNNKSSTKFMEKPVEQLDNLEEKDIYICIAVHEAMKYAIEKNLQQHNRSNYIWIAPYIDELLFGKPIAYHKNVKTIDILRSQNVDHIALAVRYLVIESFYDGTDAGDGIYLKMVQYMYVNKETAKCRLDNFKKLINNWNEVGYQEDKEIKIDERGQIIDGKHRFSLACYHKKEFIYCTIFPYTSDYGKYVKYKDMLNIKEMKEIGYTQYEVDMIMSAQEKLMDMFR